MNTKRPVTLTIAVMLLALLSLWHLPAPFFPGLDQVPPPVIYGDVVLGITGLFATFGLWEAQTLGDDPDDHRLRAEYAFSSAWHRVCAPCSAAFGA